MRALLLLLFMSTLLLTASCGGGSTGKSAGVKDGAIELAKARLDFGANQVPDASKSTLTLMKLKEGDHEKLDGINSDLFELYLDRTCNDPVTVTVPMADTEAPTEEGVEAMLGLGTEITLADGTINTLYTYIPAEISGDNLVATFVPSEHMEELVIHAADGAAKPSREKLRFGIFWVYTSFEDGGHFLVKFPFQKGSFFLGYADREQLLSDLEAVYNAYIDKGFAYSQRKSWPMNVNIQSLDAMGYYSCDWNIAEGQISLNRSLFAGGYDANSVKPLLAHEFFHFVQGNYIGSAGDLLWLDEATATYFEGEASGSIPSIVNEHDTKIFEGVFPADNTAAQGYSRMVLIKYLSGKLGEDFIKNVYTIAESGASWEDALLSAMGPPQSWAPDFYKAIVTGDVGLFVPYTIHSNLAKGSMGEVGTSLNLEIPTPEKIKSMLDDGDSPLLGSTSLSIDAFGAKLVAITIDEKSLEKLEDGMDPVVSVSDGHLTVFSVKGRNVEVMAGGNLKDFKTASKDKTVFLALVTGLHEKGKQNYEVKVEFPAAPSLDELVGLYQDGSVFFKSVTIPANAYEAPDDDAYGCDFNLLPALKKLEGSTRPFVLNVSKTGEATGTLLLIFEEQDEDDDGISPFPFTYSNGAMTFGFRDSTDGNVLISGLIKASYGQKSDVVLAGDLSINEGAADEFNVDLVISGTKPLSL